MAKLLLTQIQLKAMRLLALASLVSLLLHAPSAFAQSPIPCGQVTTGAIITVGQENRYTFSASAGDVVNLRLVTTTNNFTPQMQLLFGAQLLVTSTTEFTRTLTQAGAYTIAVRSVGSSQTGAYQLIWQRTKGPCGAIQISECQIVKGSLSGPADEDAYVFNGTAGQPIVLEFQPLTTNLNLSSAIGLFDPDGTLVSTNASVISTTLTKTGVHTVLVATNLFNGMAGNYILRLGNMGVLISSPNGGEILLAGTAFAIKWRSEANNPSLASHDILLSTDGGVTFPTAIVSGISSTTQSYDWRISPALATNNARIRVVAKDSGGRVCQDDSNASFTVAGLSSMTPVAYKYDELSRLTQAVYDDGTGITYTYDAAGNRLSEVVAPVPFFKIACNPGTVNASAPTACTVTSLNGFNSPVTIGCADAPTGVTCGLNPLTVTPPPNGSINSTVTVNANSTVPTGTYSFQARGTGGGFVRAFNMTLSVPSPTLQFSAASFVVAEGAGSVQIPINRLGSNPVSVALDYATANAGSQNCNVVNGIASSRCDFLATLGTQLFGGNETSKAISIPIVDDSYAEGNETFTITLSNPAGATLGPTTTATITITDNDSSNGANPTDQAGFFVRQHYLDFLNRQPDAAGLAFWTNEITSCGANAQCIEIKRINVSAAFYLSIEFQQTGYLVERLYKAAYGDGTGTSTLGGVHQLAVPIVRLNEFLADTREIGRGVVVGQTGWEQLLENNTQAFTAAFVQRSRFTTAFPSTMTPAQFVDKLNTNAGNPLSQSERDQLVSGLTSGAKTRAQVLRGVAEDPDLNNSEFNRAFVLMQYFGYMRRNPNDPQDPDHTGYDFWLTKLNQFNGNFINAEMVKAFISSIEYRQRFGP